MSSRSGLRVLAMERAGSRCEFPGCVATTRLQLAHLHGSGMGGSKYRDVSENVAVLCETCHDWLDCRITPNMRRLLNEEVLRAALGREWKDRR